jgi:para-nitrobenzyl esterase
MSTCAMLTSPAARGLVDKAAVSSGSCRLDWPAGGLFPGVPESTPYTSLAQDRSDGVAAAKGLGCTTNTLSCMRSKPAAELLPLNQDFSDHLAYGTPVLPLDPATALREGRFLRVPVISGGNADEARAFLGGAAQADPTLITATTYPKLVGAAFGTAANRVLARYPLSEYKSPLLAWSTVVTDESWGCQTATADQELARHTTVYPYEFADPDAPNVNGIDVPGFSPGAAHASDLPSLFDLGGFDLLGTPAQHAMAATMVAYWTTFAHTGDPNHVGAPTWAAGTAHGTRQLRFVPGDVASANVSAEHQCGFWSTIH